MKNVGSEATLQLAVSRLNAVRREEQGSAAQHADSKNVRNSGADLDHTHPQPESHRVEDVQRNREDEESDGKCGGAAATGESGESVKKEQKRKNREPRLLDEEAQRVQGEGGG